MAIAAFKEATLKALTRNHKDRPSAQVMVDYWKMHQRLDLNQCIGKDDDGDTSLILRMGELDGSEGTIEYTGNERILSCTYEGNRKNLDKALSIIHSNTSFKPWHFFLSITESDIHSETQELPQIHSIWYLHIFITCNLNQESGNKLSRICMSLHQSFPSLFQLYLNGCGSTVLGIGEMYQYLNLFLPKNSFRFPSLGFFDIILRFEAQKTISASVAANNKIWYISLSPTDRTIHSMTEFTRALAICHNSTSLNIADLHLTAENKVYFLAALEQWKHLEWLRL